MEMRELWATAGISYRGGNVLQSFGISSPKQLFSHFSNYVASHTGRGWLVMLPWYQLMIMGWNNIGPIISDEIGKAIFDHYTSDNEEKMNTQTAVDKA